jgi:hypothetical protein
MIEHFHTSYQAGFSSDPWNLDARTTRMFWSMMEKIERVQLKWILVKAGEDDQWALLLLQLSYDLQLVQVTVILEAFASGPR